MVLIAAAIGPTYATIFHKMTCATDQPSYRRRRLARAGGDILRTAGAGTKGDEIGRLVGAAKGTRRYMVYMRGAEKDGRGTMTTGRRITRASRRAALPIAPDQFLLAPPLDAGGKAV